jgi:hypothetical protein
VYLYKILKMSQEFSTKIKNVTKESKKCIEPDCTKSTIGKTNKCKKHGGGKRCTEINCKKSARDKTDKCVEHGGGKRCTEPDCKKSAQGKTDKCVAHGGGKRCTEINCKKSSHGKTDKCVAHGGGKRCIEPDCKTFAIGKTDKCAAHGGGKRCTEINCKKSAQGKTDKCAAHGGGKRCTEPDCKSGSHGKSDKCVAHGGGKRCTEINCKKSARSKSDKCAAHGGGKRCTEPDCKKSSISKNNKCAAHGGGKRCPNCIDWIDSRSSSSIYDGYCATCFKLIFPNDERSKIVYRHNKEIMVRNIINKKFDGFLHDTALYTDNCDCTHRRRIDHRKLIGNTILAIETDEFGHRGYDQKDEEIRYDDLYMIHSGKWIFIRFNPDNNVSKTDIEDKLNKLVETITNCIYRIEQEENTELLEIIKLYC